MWQTWMQGDRDWQGLAGRHRQREIVGDSEREGDTGRGKDRWKEIDVKGQWGRKIRGREDGREGYMEVVGGEPATMGEDSTKAETVIQTHEDRQR